MAGLPSQSPRPRNHSSFNDEGQGFAFLEPGLADLDLDLVDLADPADPADLDLELALVFPAPVPSLVLALPDHRAQDEDLDLWPVPGLVVVAHRVQAQVVVLVLLLDLVRDLARGLLRDDLVLPHKPLRRS